jgi:hypothetical protein
MAKNDDKSAQELQKSADKVKDVSDDLAKLAQKIASTSDEKAKQKLLDQYQTSLRALSSLQKDQNDLMKEMIQNMKS